MNTTSPGDSLKFIGLQLFGYSNIYTFSDCKTSVFCCLLCVISDEPFVRETEAEDSSRALGLDGWGLAMPECWGLLVRCLLALLVWPWQRPQEAGATSIHSAPDSTCPYTTNVSIHLFCICIFSVEYQSEKEQVVGMYTWRVTMLYLTFYLLPSYMFFWLCTFSRWHRSLFTSVWLISIHPFSLSWSFEARFYLTLCSEKHKHLQRINLQSSWLANLFREYLWDWLLHTRFSSSARFGCGYYLLLKRKFQ